MWRSYEDYDHVVREALIENRRFAERAKAYLKKGTANASKEAAAMKRSSMDLTRALVKVRGRD